MRLTLNGRTGEAIRLVAKLNEAMRRGTYREDLWKQRTGKTVRQLADEWKRSLPRASARANRDERG